MVTILKINRNYVKQNHINALEVGGEEITNKQQIRNDINDLFTKINWKHWKIGLAKCIFIHNLYVNTVSDAFRLRWYIKWMVLNCKSKNYFDSDNISMYLIQQTIISIIKPLTYILNSQHVFRTSKFASKLKLAKTIPVFKKSEI